MNKIQSNTGFIALGFSFLFLFSLTQVQAATIKVKCDSKKTIQAAVDKAAPGDVIEVQGTCNENVVIPDEIHRITLDGGGTTTINGPDATEPDIKINGRGVIVRGFTITGGRTGIFVRAANTIIEDNIIKNTGRHGVVVGESSSATIVDNTIQNNPNIGIFIAQSSFALIGIRTTADTVASPNVIQNNGSMGIQVGGSSSAFIVGNTVSGNGNDGIRVRRGSHAEIADNEINSNVGDGIDVRENSGVNLGVNSGADILELPNHTTGNNTEFGVRCETNSYGDGRLGTLNGANGGKDFSAGSCVDSLI